MRRFTCSSVCVCVQLLIGEAWHDVLLAAVYATRSLLPLYFFCSYIVFVLLIFGNGATCDAMLFGAAADCAHAKRERTVLCAQFSRASSATGSKAWRARRACGCIGCTKSATKSRCQQHAPCNASIIGSSLPSTCRALPRRVRCGRVELLLRGAALATHPPTTYTMAGTWLQVCETPCATSPPPDRVCHARGREQASGKQTNRVSEKAGTFFVLFLFLSFKHYFT